MGSASAMMQPEIINLNKGLVPRYLIGTVEVAGAYQHSRGNLAKDGRNIVTCQRNRRVFAYSGQDQLVYTHAACYQRKEGSLMRSPLRRLYWEKWAYVFRESEDSAKG